MSQQPMTRLMLAKDTECVTKNGRTFLMAGNEVYLAADVEAVEKRRIVAENEICTATDQIPPDMEGDSLSTALIKLKDTLAAKEAALSQVTKELSGIDKELRGKVNDPDQLPPMFLGVFPSTASYTTTYGLAAGLLRERDTLQAELLAERGIKEAEKKILVAEIEKNTVLQAQLAKLQGLVDIYKLDFSALANANAADSARLKKILETPVEPVVTIESDGRVTIPVETYQASQAELATWKDNRQTEDELQRIKEWPIPCTTESAQAWFDFIRGCWWQPDWGWTQEGDTLNISTGGWSGNEDIIRAMMDNFIFWSLCWESSRRGGHYTFKLPSPETGRPATTLTPQGGVG